MKRTTASSEDKERLIDYVVPGFSCSYPKDLKKKRKFAGFLTNIDSLIIELEKKKSKDEMVLFIYPQKLSFHTLYDIKCNPEYYKFDKRLEVIRAGDYPSFP